MFSESRLMYLPIALIDVSPVRSDRRIAEPTDDDDEVPAPHVSRRARIVAAVQANIVRLVPGATHLPFEPAPR